MFSLMVATTSSLETQPLKHKKGVSIGDQMGRVVWIGTRHDYFGTPQHYSNRVRTSTGRHGLCLGLDASPSDGTGTTRLLLVHLGPC